LALSWKPLVKSKHTAVTTTRTRMNMPYRLPGSARSV
jgi:hypothetical protein